jgi:hypothetical protein
MYKILNSLKEIGHDQPLFSSFYFKAIELPVSANYSYHRAPQKTRIHETLLSLEGKGLPLLQQG